RGALIYDLSAIGHYEQSLFPGMSLRTVGMYVPPFAVAWLVPLGLVAVAWVGPLWLAFLLATLVVSLILLKKCFHLTLWQIFLVWAVLAVFGPAYEALRIGQISPILLMALCLAIAGIQKDRPALAGL